jgi:hypothetical protein
MSDYTIPFPDRHSEFEVQAKIYSELLSRGITVRGEVVAACLDNGKEVGARMDLVVYVNRKAAAVVECKNYDESSECRWIGDRQHRKYNSFGVPVLFCDKMSKVSSTIQAVVDYLNTGVFNTVPSRREFIRSKIVDALSELGVPVRCNEMVDGREYDVVVRNSLGHPIAVVDCQNKKVWKRYKYVAAYACARPNRIPRVVSEIDELTKVSI